MDQIPKREDRTADPLSFYQPGGKVSGSRLPAGRIRVTAQDLNRER